MEGGEGAVTLGQVAPRIACAQNPENPIEHFAVVGSGMAGLARTLGRQQRTQQRILLIGEIEAGGISNALHDRHPLRQCPLPLFYPLSKLLIPREEIVIQSLV